MQSEAWPEALKVQPEMLWHSQIGSQHAVSIHHMVLQEAADKLGLGIVGSGSHQPIIFLIPVLRQLRGDTVRRQLWEEYRGQRTGDGGTQVSEDSCRRNTEVGGEPWRNKGVRGELREECSGQKTAARGI